ncbi:MAG: hypothetical protein FWC26_03340 [Fibromonadales bacterium]|nr:hypothetical protein [Fibromonadales bacterium]
MKNLYVMLFAFFTMPLAVFAQSKYCFSDREIAELVRLGFREVCLFNSGIPSLTIILGDGVNSDLHCVSGHCSTCQFEYDRIANVAADECCIMEKSLKQISHLFILVKMSYKPVSSFILQTYVYIFKQNFSFTAK